MHISADGNRRQLIVDSARAYIVTRARAPLRELTELNYAIYRPRPVAVTRRSAVNYRILASEDKKPSKRTRGRERGRGREGGREREEKENDRSRYLLPRESRRGNDSNEYRMHRHAFAQRSARNDVLQAENFNDKFFRIFRLFFFLNAECLFKWCRCDCGLLFERRICTRKRIRFIRR